MVGPGIFGERGSQGVIIIRPDASLLFAEADIIIIVCVCVRSAGFKHKIVRVIKSETIDEHMSALVAVAVKTLDRTGDVASECHAAVRIVDTLAAAAGSVTSQFDTISVAGE